VAVAAVETVGCQRAAALVLVADYQKVVVPVPVVDCQRAAVMALVADYRWVGAATPVVANCRKAEPSGLQRIEAQDH
jgi:hypothetical protein